MSADTERDEGKAVIATLKSRDMQQRFIEALPPDITVDRFTRVVATAVAQRPEILQADRTSLYLAATRAAQDGLLPDGREGVFNIYNTNTGTKQAPKWTKKVQWMPMVEGVIKQMAKAGIRVTASSVYQADKFRYWTDDHGQHVEHEPALFAPDRGPRIGAYAIGRTDTGFTQIEVMNADELSRARAASKNADGEIFKQWGDRMEQKTVIHRLRKRMAITDDKVTEFLRRDEKADLIDDDDEAMPEPPPTIKPDPAKPRPRTLQAVVDYQKQEPVGQPAMPEDDLPPPVGPPPSDFADF